MDESRKAFESWIANTTNSDLHRGIMLDRRESGSYSHLATENKWEAWQASRAAIEINLPDIELVTDTLTAPGDGWEVYDAQKVDKVLRADGIKVKE
ncbi:TPA: hypothetical protein QHR04_004513 [Enterobacter kobei]|nr:hypothetical protein [Enterobacter kobei]